MVWQRGHAGAEWVARPGASLCATPHLSVHIHLLIDRYSSGKLLSIIWQIALAHSLTDLSLHLTNYMAQEWETVHGDSPCSEDKQ